MTEALLQVRTGQRRSSSAGTSGVAASGRAPRHLAGQHNAGTPPDFELAEFARLPDALARRSGEVPIAVTACYP
jgi:hypothetical protein